MFFQSALPPSSQPVAPLPDESDTVSVSSCGVSETDKHQGREQEMQGSSANSTGIFLIPQVVDPSATTLSVPSHDDKHRASLFSIPKRERWSGRLSFWFATIGGAVGIGNLWRFPGLCYEYGGGAFFIPYLVALFFIGIPLLTLEFAIGQCFQGGHLVAFNHLSRRFRGVGVAAIFVGFMVTCYYTVILSWGLRYFVDSFQSSYPWTLPEAQLQRCTSQITSADCVLHQFCTWNSEQATCVGDINAKAKSYFETEVIGQDMQPAVPHLNYYVMLGLVVVWLVIFLALFKGVRSTGIMVYVTMSLPLILLLVLAIRGVMLEGAAAGLHQYMGKWDFSVLWKRPEIWSQAAGQIYFSIGVGYGVMTAYASYNRVDQNIAVDSLLVSLSNSAVSLIAGVAVFTVAGFLATSIGVLNDAGEVDISKLDIGGPSLVFVMYPLALSTIPYSQWLCVIFFLTFFLLGIDSGFALAEALLTLLFDSRIVQEWFTHRRWLMAAVVCVVGWAVGLPYCMTSGIFLLDSVNNYLAVIASLFIGACEATAAGWMYGSGRQAARIGYRPVLLFATGYFLSAICGAFIGYGLPYDLAFYGLVAGAALLLVLTVAAVVATPSVDGVSGDRLCLQERCYLVFLYNVELLREELNSVCCSKLEVPTVVPPSSQQPSTVCVDLPIDSRETRKTYNPPMAVTESPKRHSAVPTVDPNVGIPIPKVVPTVDMSSEKAASVAKITQKRGCSKSMQQVFPLNALQSITILFSLTIKFVIPMAMIILLGQTFSRQSITNNSFFDPKKYAWYIHLVGVLLAGIAVALVVLGWVWPEVYRPLLPRHEPCRVDEFSKHPVTHRKIVDTNWRRQRQGSRSKS